MHPDSQRGRALTTGSEAGEHGWNYSRIRERFAARGCAVRESVFGVVRAVIVEQPPSVAGRRDLLRFVRDGRLTWLAERFDEMGDARQGHVRRRGRGRPLPLDGPVRRRRVIRVQPGPSGLLRGSFIQRGRWIRRRKDCSEQSSRTTT